MVPPGQPAHPAKEKILKHLGAVLDSPLFARAERQRRFLEYVVRQTLEGRAHELKEYPIGVAVYERPEGYDPREDPIVRVEALRLRARLREYYSSLNEAAAIRIDLPKGSYVPEFVLPDTTTDAPKPVRERGWVPWAAGVAVALVVGAVWWVNRPRPAMNEQASIHYQKARQMHMLMTAESLRDAIEEQRKAVAADPAAAVVHSGMAHILISRFSVEGVSPGREPLAEVQPWIDRSFKLEPGNPDAWAAVIRVNRDLELDFAKAENTCREALRRRSAAIPIELNCAMIDAVRGRREPALATIESIMRAMPTREAVLMTYANALYVSRRYEELLAHCRQVRKQSPSLWEALTLEAAALVALGRAQEAVDLLRAAPDLEASDPLRNALAFALARAGQRKEAEEWLARVESQRARILLALGRREEALAWLEAEWERRSIALWSALTDPAVQELAGDPRFERIRKGMKL